MPDCSLSLLERHLLPTVAGALLTLVVAALVAHRLLQTFLEARGVAPWTMSDSLMAMPLVLVGAAAVGAATTLGAGLPVSACQHHGNAILAAEIAVVVLALTGFLMLHFGLRSLGKFT